MSNAFTNIPVRSNADTGLVDAGWWNAIRTALVNTFGSGAIDETQFTIADNQSSYQNITGLLLDASVTCAAEIRYTIYRTDGATEFREMGILYCMYKAVAGTWSYEREFWGDDALGNGTISSPLALTTAGQVQYKSHSVGGTYQGKMRYKSVVAFAKET